MIGKTLKTNRKIDKPLLIVTHERSGTHFMGNSIGLNSEYDHTAKINFDQSNFPHINYYHPFSLQNGLENIHKNKCGNVLISHMSGHFFDQVNFEQYCHVIHVYRNPVDTLLSYRRITQQQIDYGHSWTPVGNDIKEFLLSEPSGASLKFQMHQHKNIIERWENHVDSWIDKAFSVRYEDLESNYDSEMRRVLSHLNITVPDTIVRPKDNIENCNYVLGKKSISDTERKELMDLILSNLTIDRVRNLVYDKYHA